MKKFLFVLCFSPLFVFSQSREELKIKFKNSIAVGTIYDEESFNEYSDKVIDFYECVSKKYKVNIKDESEFLNKDEFIKKYGSDEIGTIEQNSFRFKAYAGNYQLRIALQKGYKKCIKKSEINY